MGDWPVCNFIMNKQGILKGKIKGDKRLYKTFVSNHRKWIFK